MATDNIDLSFIKCPACQSLAPAISKRCRMCGANLHAEGEESATQQKKGRVRQRTMSSQASEVGDALSEVRGSFVPPVKDAPSHVTNEEVPGSAPDPLGEYLAEDDFEVEPDEVSKPPQSEKHLTNGKDHAVSGKGMQMEATPKQDFQQDQEEEVAELVKNVSRVTPAATVAPVKAAPVAQSKAAPARSAVRKESAVGGRLVGWLVSYQDPAGSAIELREGKFFVSRSQIKGENDFIVDHESVSSPHAMMRVSPGKIAIQDLMSERGVFRRPRGTEVYRPEEEPFTLEHGDWIRFGDIEYLVSLIAHVGEV